MIHRTVTIILISTPNADMSRCNDPLDTLTEANRSLVNADFISPAVEGTNVTFSCTDPQLLLNGPKIAKCTENGTWEPDPRNVKCIQTG